MTLKHFEASKSAKKQHSENHGKVRNNVKSACFLHVFCYISAIFEDIDMKFCTHIHETVPSKICSVFFENLIWGGNCFEKIDIF